jgi:hypothetical protein
VAKLNDGFLTDISIIKYDDMPEVQIYAGDNCAFIDADDLELIKVYKLEQVL